MADTSTVVEQTSCPVGQPAALCCGHFFTELLEDRRPKTEEAVHAAYWSFLKCRALAKPDAESIREAKKEGLQLLRKHGWENLANIIEEGLDSGHLREMVQIMSSRVSDEGTA